MDLNTTRLPSGDHRGLPFGARVEREPARHAAATSISHTSVIPLHRRAAPPRAGHRAPAPDCLARSRSGGPTVPRAMPARSTQTSCRRSPAAGPMREHAGRRHRKRAPHHASVQSDGLGHGDRLATDHPARLGRSADATSTPCCTHNSAPGGAYTAAVSAASTRVGSPPSSVPRYTPRVSGRPYPTKKRKWRPSGRNCGQRWLPWPGASRVTATGVPPVAITRIRSPTTSGANTMTPSRFHVPPRPLGASAST